MHDLKYNLVLFFGKKYVNKMLIKHLIYFNFFAYIV